MKKTNEEIRGGEWMWKDFYAQFSYKFLHRFDLFSIVFSVSNWIFVFVISKSTLLFPSPEFLLPFIHSVTYSEKKKDGNADNIRWS